ncbi:GFA family protein [Paraglaciecola aquimarina]|uniref:GFA family protein n=1 Tax=Paraglaciecola aquimarina TaxID=1235557 RepID=A0ABU3SZA3_9ALTE|nr:GFA family protein [Paraglaciecola aquimarina]MDU0355345.1 GFA family protein [Paraglaciecola aquimarina]
MSVSVKGSCLCGQVKSTITGPFQRFYQCYCDRCQKKTGSAFASLIFTTPDKIEWHCGQQQTKRFDLPNAVRFSNNFCTNCGSQVPYLSRDGSQLVIPAGYLDDDPEIRPMANIFKEETPCWFDEGQAATKFDQYPV